MENNKLPKAAYTMLLEMDQNGKQNWVTKVKNILFKYGFGRAFISQDVEDPNLFFKTFKQRLIDCATQEWSHLICNSSKLRT